LPCHGPDQAGRILVVLLARLLGPVPLLSRLSDWLPRGERPAICGPGLLPPVSLVLAVWHRQGRVDDLRRGPLGLRRGTCPDSGSRGVSPALPRPRGVRRRAPPRGRAHGGRPRAGIP